MTRFRRRATPARKYTSQRRMAGQQNAGPDAGLTTRKRKRIRYASSALSTPATASWALESSAPTLSTAARRLGPTTESESHTRRLNLAMPDDPDAPSTRPTAPTEHHRPSPKRPERPERSERSERSERNKPRSKPLPDQSPAEGDYFGAPFTFLDGPDGTNGLATQFGDQSSPSPTTDPAAATNHEDETIQVDSDATMPDTADMSTENARRAAPSRVAPPRRAAQPPPPPLEPQRPTRTPQRRARDSPVTRFSTRLQSRRVEQMPFRPPGPAVPRSDAQPVTTTRTTTATRKPSPKRRPVLQTRVPVQTSTFARPATILASSSSPPEASLEGSPNIAAVPTPTNPDPIEPELIANGTDSVPVSVPVRVDDIQVYALLPPGQDSTAHLASRARLAIQGAFGPPDPTRFTRYDLSLDQPSPWGLSNPSSKPVSPPTSSQSNPPHVPSLSTCHVGNLGPSMADSPVDDAIPSSFAPELEMALVPANISTEQPQLPSWTDSADAHLGNVAQPGKRATQSAHDPPPSAQVQGHRTKPAHDAAPEGQRAMEAQADPRPQEPKDSERVRLSSDATKLMRKLARGWYAPQWNVGRWESQLAKHDCASMGSISLGVCSTKVLELMWTQVLRICGFTCLPPREEAQTAQEDPNPLGPLGADVLLGPSHDPTALTPTIRVHFLLPLQSATLLALQQLGARPSI